MIATEKEKGTNHACTELRTRWHQQELASKKYEETKGFLSRAGLPGNLHARLTGDGLSTASSPSVHQLPLATPYGPYGVCIKQSDERWASTRVAGSACTMLKTNSFVTSSLLEQDGADVMSAYGELGKAWRFACRCIQTQSPLVTRTSPFLCERAVTVGDSANFGTVQVHRGTWSIPQGSEQGSLKVRRCAVSVDGTVLAETVNISMRRGPDAPISSITLTATAIIPEAGEVRLHGSNASLQSAMQAEDSVVSRIVVGLIPRGPVVGYGAFGDTGDNHATGAVDHGIMGLASIGRSCKSFCNTHCKELTATALVRECKHIKASYDICNEEGIKAAVFNGKDLDLVVVSTLTCLPH